MGGSKIRAIAWPTRQRYADPAAKMLADAAAAHSCSSYGGVGHLCGMSDLAGALTVFIDTEGSAIILSSKRMPLRFADEEGVGYGLYATGLA